MKKKKKKKKKTKMEDFEVFQLLAEHGRLFSRSVYSMAVLSLTLHRLVLAVFSLFRDFAPIPMYRENEITRTIPT